MSATPGEGDDATPDAPAWRSSAGVPPTHAPFPRSFFARGVEVVARELLGARLVSDIGGVRTSGVIVETEAYGGPADPASHAATRGGPTARNAAMFGPAGVAYVYRSYGVHWCMNVVTGQPDRGEAVLLRALAPLEGLDAMVARRGRARWLTSGPGRLCEALGVTGDLYGHVLDAPPLQVLPGWRVSHGCVACTPRVGVSKAADWPLRFCVRGEPNLSRNFGEGAIRTRDARRSAPHPG